MSITNNGWWRRFRRARGHQLAGQDGAIAADARQDHVGLGNEMRELVEAVGRRLEPHGEIRRALGRAVRDGDGFEPCPAERRQRRLDHLARADQERPLVAEILEDLLREIHRDPRHGDGAFGDAGLGPDALGGGERVLEEAGQDRAAGLAVDGGAVGVLDLAQDLRLAHDHRVEGRRHPQHVLHGLAFGEFVEVVFEARLVAGACPSQVAPEERAQAMARSVEVARERHDLDAIAGGDQHRLVDLVGADELLQRRRHVVHGQPLAHLERGAPVVQADEDDLHAKNSTPITANKRKRKPPIALAAAWRAPWRVVKRAATTTAYTAHAITDHSS